MLSIVGVVVGVALISAGAVAGYRLRRETGSLKPVVVGMVFVLGGSMLVAEGLGLV